MSMKHSARYKLIRGGLLAGSILSFIPVFALVRSNVAADGNSGSSVTAISSDDDSPYVAPSTTQPSTRQPYYTQPSTSSQAQPQTTVPMRTRIRTRAS